jgi:hypothetical protein
MCEPISAGIAAGVGALATVAGTVMSSQAQSAQARAIAAQNRATMQAQQQGFTERLRAGQAQTAGQAAAMQQTLQDQTAAAQQMRDAQMSALKGYQSTLDTENVQAAKLRDTGDTAAQTLLGQTTGPALDQAQTTSAAQAAALLQPSLPPGPQPTDPSGGNNATTSDPNYQSALARRTAEAATNIRTYGGRIGQVESYNAPLEAINLATSANKTGIMPAQTADYLLRSGSNVRLLPSQVAYGAATGEGQAAQGLLQSRGQNALDAASLSYGNATDIANLTQSDADTLAANKAKQATADAQFQQSLGGLVSGIGNLGLYGAGRYGGFGNLFGSGVNASNVTNHGA